MTPLLTLALIWAIAAIVMAGTWAVATRLDNLGYVDVAWAGLMAIAAFIAGISGSGDELVRGLVAMLGSVWAARLCLYLLRRVLSEEEDGRYRALRAAWQDDPVKLFGFFQLQAAVVALFAIPFVAAAFNTGHRWMPWTVAAILVWLIAVIGESVADRQLARFRKQPDNHGKTCRDGLWRWSRHPNYFFEWLHWFTYVFLAISSPWFGLSLVGPVLMLAFLYRVSGIPWTEAQALRSRGEDYARYQREVSAFFPWPPRSH